MDNFQTEIIPEPPKAESHSGCFSFVIDTLETVLLALILFFGINAISARVRVENISMQPTLKQGEFILVNKLAYKLGSPRLGDIIIFHYPKDPEEDYIKRVIGVPGDEIVIDNGVVSVNGQALDESYISAPPNYTGNWSVPENSLFVLGDNRNQSSDSHSWGFVPFENVVGKAVLIYWPLDSIRVFNQVTTAQAAQTQ